VVISQSGVFFSADPRYPSVKADLLGDDISTPSDPVVAVPGGHKTNEDLLAEIFGGSTAMSTTTTTTNAATPTPTSSQPQKTTAADILGLFDSPTPSASPQAQQAPPSAAMSLFDLDTPAAPAAPPPKPATPNLPSYTAYNKNDVVISLTPQRSTAQPGVVDILARFQVKGSTAAIGLNFQVAVPKVSNNQPPSPNLLPLQSTLTVSAPLFYFPRSSTDTTVTNATHVTSGCQPRSNRDTANAHYCSNRREYSFRYLLHAAN
jgi:AP-1 complex subunit gamma-1